MTTLAEAARASTLKAAATAYLKTGVSIVPLVGKRATIAWTKYQHRKPTITELYWWAERSLLQNVGIVCGQVSSNLLVIDLDGLNAVATFEQRFPLLLETFTVRSGSGRGLHLYYRIEDLPQTSRALNIPGGGNVELRANGCYIVAPPSVHPDTAAAYTVYRPYPPLSLRNLVNVQKWLHTLNQPRVTQKHANAQSNGKRAILFGYAVTALDRETARLRSAPEGSRNDQLNRAAYNLGQLIGDNLIPRWQVEETLLTAAQAVGLGEREARATIKSGVEAGMKNPRSRRHG